MKIKIKTTLKQLRVLNQVWALNVVPGEHENPTDSHGNTKELRVIASVAAMLKKKLLKKEIDKEGEFETKELTLSFEYFEYYYLEIIASLGAEKYSQESYERNTLRKLAGEINQKLA